MRDFVRNKHASFKASTLSKMELHLMYFSVILSTVQKQLFQKIHFNGCFCNFFLYR